MLFTPAGTCLNPCAANGKSDKTTAATTSILNAEALSVSQDYPSAIIKDEIPIEAEHDKCSKVA